MLSCRRGHSVVADARCVGADNPLTLAPLPQVRVVHGKEPNHFMAMFGGKLIIYEGGKAGWGQGKDEGPGDTYLLHVRGTSIYNTKAEQVGGRGGGAVGRGVGAARGRWAQAHRWGQPGGHEKNPVV